MPQAAREVASSTTTRTPPNTAAGGAEDERSIQCPLNQNFFDASQLFDLTSDRGDEWVRPLQTEVTPPLRSGLF